MRARCAPWLSACAIIGAVALFCVPAVLSLTMGARSDSASSFATPSAWRRVHVGTRLYTAGGYVWDSRQPICRSAAAAWQNLSQGSTRACVGVAYGVPVTVTSISASRCDHSFSSWDCRTILKVRAQDGAWSGYSPLEYFQPDIVRGTTLLMVRDWSSPNWLMPHPYWTADSVEIGSEAVVRALKYEPRNRNGTVFGVVLTGEFRNRKGWVSVAGVEPVIGQSSRYGLLEPWNSP